MRRGFTLIELLAVIVILAIIALIATPIVLDIIDEARSGSNERTIENIMHASELYYAQESMDGNSNISGNIYKDVVKTVDGDTPEILQKRVMEQAEWVILPKAIDLIANGKVK